MTIALATCTMARDIDADLPLIRAAARARSHDATIVTWDDPTIDWHAYDAVVVRSCWDYVPRRESFLAWAADVPRLHNRANVLRWNTDKVYLRQLEEAGVPIIETRWDVAVGDEIGDHREWVVKPTVSAGSRDTARWASAEEVYAHSASLLTAGRRSMTQPYIASVDDEGETAMLFFGGTFSHAIRKAPLLQPGEGVRQDRDSRESITPRAPTAAQHEVAAVALDATATILGLTEAPLYARVDLVTARSGEPVVIELELTEPSLFLPDSDGGATRLVEALLERIDAR
jgi:glutathione synthase/RimK-type ligase-like ATP-grasp enzyme